MLPQDPEAAVELRWAARGTEAQAMHNQKMDKR
jgi:hypothetical protein